MDQKSIEKAMCKLQVAECAGQSMSRQHEVVRTTPGSVQCRLMSGHEEMAAASEENITVDAR
jgi:hypothetical protein